MLCLFSFTIELQPLLSCVFFLLPQTSSLCCVVSVFFHHWAPAPAMLCLCLPSPPSAGLFCVCVCPTVNNWATAFFVLCLCSSCSKQLNYGLCCVVHVFLSPLRYSLSCVCVHLTVKFVSVFVFHHWAPAYAVSFFVLQLTTEQQPLLWCVFVHQLAINNWATAFVVLRLCSSCS